MIRRFLTAGAAAVLAGTVALAGHAFSAHAATTPAKVAAPAPPAAPAVPTPAARPAPARPAAPVVAPLHALTPPDVLIQLSGPATAAQLHALAHAGGVAAVVPLAVGQVRTPVAVLTVAGVDPSAFRAFTPKLSAASDPLWQAVARGGITVDYRDAAALRPWWGRDLPVAGARAQRLFLAAFATLGVPGVDAVVDAPTGAALGLSPARWVLLAAPQLSLEAIQREVAGALGYSPRLDFLRPQYVNQAEISPYAQRVIPAAYLALYRAAATTCPGLPWTVLAAIGTVETGNGRDAGVSSAGAEGPMQFLPSTWAAYGMNVDGGPRANINDPVDAVYSAARYLCLAGGGRGGQSLYDAIYAYNHADWYVREVLNLAVAYQ